MSPLSILYLFATLFLTLVSSTIAAQDVVSPAVGTIVRPFACTLSADTTGMDTDAYTQARNAACNDIVELDIGPGGTDLYKNMTYLWRGFKIKTTLTWVNKHIDDGNTECDTKYSGGVAIVMDVCQDIYWSILYDPEAGCGISGGKVSDQCIDYQVVPNPGDA